MSAAPPTDEPLVMTPDQIADMTWLARGESGGVTEAELLRRLTLTVEGGDECVAVRGESMTLGVTPHAMLSLTYRGQFDAASHRTAFWTGHVLALDGKPAARFQWEEPHSTRSGYATGDERLATLSGTVLLPYLNAPAVRRAMARGEEWFREHSHVRVVFSDLGWSGQDFVDLPTDSASFSGRTVLFTSVEPDTLTLLACASERRGAFQAPGRKVVAVGCVLGDDVVCMNPARRPTVVGEQDQVEVVCRV